MTLIRYRTRPMETTACHACGAVTPWGCMACGKPTCATCQFSYFAMCRPCRNGVTESISTLQKKSDAYIWAEFDRMFV